MSELVVPDEYGTEYFTCRFCWGRQIVRFSVRIPKGAWVSDEHKTPGKEWLLCNSCWRKHRVEAVMQELMK